MKMLVGTWNVGNKSPPEDLSPWIAKQGFDLIAIGKCVIVVVLENANHHYHHHDHLSYRCSRMRISSSSPIQNLC